MKLLSALFLLAFIGTTLAASAEQWRGRSIYQVLTDRFALNYTCTDAADCPCDVSLDEYCGGTWKGIEMNLDYIYNMGFTAVWISPVTKNTPQGYHGYYQTDLYSLNENFGTAQDLVDLSAALHNKSMYLMVDVVTNHFGSSTDYPDIPYDTYVPFNSSDYFHPYCAIDYNNQTSAEQCWLDANLPDVRTEDAAIVTAYSTWITALVANYSIDGLRIDSVKDVDKASMPPFCEAAGVYCLGELSNNAGSYAYPYQNVLNGGGIINYPMYFSFNESFLYPATASMQDFAYNTYVCANGSTCGSDGCTGCAACGCKDSTLQGTFTENHDNPRVAWANPDIQVAANAIVWTILSDGIPIIYEGQEQHLAGADDPYCREAMWLCENGCYNTSAPLHGTVAYVNQIYNWASAQSSTYSTYHANSAVQTETQIQLRKDVVRTVLTNAGTGQAAGTFTTEQAGFTAGDVVYEMFSCSTYTADASGNVAVDTGGGKPKVLMVQSFIAGSTMCGQ